MAAFHGARGVAGHQRRPDGGPGRSADHWHRGLGSELPEVRARRSVAATVRQRLGCPPEHPIDPRPQNPAVRIQRIRLATTHGPRRWPRCCRLRAAARSHRRQYQCQRRADPHPPTLRERYLTITRPHHGTCSRRRHPLPDSHGEEEDSVPPGGETCLYVLACPSGVGAECWM